MLDIIHLLFTRHFLFVSSELFILLKIFRFTLWLSSFKPPRSGFTDLGLIPGLGRIMNIPVFYHEVSIVLYALYSNVYKVVLMNEMQLGAVRY